MKTLDTIKQFNELIQNEDIIALFYADWCPDCHVIEPLLPSFEAVNTSYTFMMIDYDLHSKICIQYDVIGIPSFIAFKDGQEVSRFVSKERKTEEEIIQFIQRLP